jgi:zinc protease
MSFGADRDHASLHLRSLARHKDEAFSMLRLALNEALLDSQSIERVRAQVLAGLRHESSDPDTIAQRRFFAEAFAGHPYANSSKGTLQTVPSITRDDLVAVKNRLFARQHLHLVVVGAIGADDLSLMLDQIFGDWPAQATLQPVPVFVDIPHGQQIVVDFDVPQSSIRLGARGLARNDPDFITASVVNHILGGGVFSSRLFREVREKRGLAYSVYSHLVPLAHGPLYVGGTSTKNERAGESLAIITAEIASLAHDGPQEAELKTAKNFLIGSHALRLDTSSKLASQLVHIKAHHLGLDYLDRRNALIDAITLQEAARVAKRLYGDGQVLSVIVGRPEGL